MAVVQVLVELGHSREGFQHRVQPGIARGGLEFGGQPGYDLAELLWIDRLWAALQPVQHPGEHDQVPVD